MDYPKRDDLLNGKFTDGDPVNGIPASRDNAAQMNAVYDEIINVIRFAGIEPSSNKYDQLKQALEFYRNANNLNDGIVPLDRFPSDILLPVGIPFPWPTDIAPSGWAIMKGQSFNTETYPALAVVYPSGIIPDMRGLAIVGAKDGEKLISYEADAVKAHGHPGSSVSSINLGNKTAATAGSHSHGTSGYMITGGSSYVAVFASGGRGDNSRGTQSGGAHSHSVAIGSHSHTVSIASWGASENTIKNRKFNYIVRLA